MCRFRSDFACAFAVAMLTLLTGPAYAQTVRQGGGASAQLLQQVQQLASERTSLQAENAKLKKDLEDMRKDRDAVKNTQQALDRRAKSSEVSLKQSVTQRESSEKELAQTKEKMQQLVGKFRETLQTLREVEAANTTSKQTLAARDESLKVCIDRNLALYKLNQEVLTRMENQSMWSRVAQAEPFTKIKRVQLENLVDEYKARADDQRIAPATAPTSSIPSTPTSVAEGTPH
jgi:chromosome segregation ATPase